MGSDIFAFTGPQLTRNFLLPLRTPTTRDRPDVILPFTSPQTTTLTPDTTQSYLKGRRSGRRAFHVSQDHQKLYYRRPIGNRYHKNHIIHRINRIQKKLETRRTPPSRGVPEAHFGANKEGPPQGGAKKAQPRGSYKRRERRALYPAWRRACATERRKRVGAADPFAPPPRQAALSRAQWFKQTMLWQHKHKRKKQKPTNHTTTTPLAYHTKLHIATQNVQGFADTLKLKSALNLMQKHDIDVLFLTETKSTQYYTYTSEQHLVILSGNNKDPHAGVGAIVAPHIRPYLADVVQHNSRIIQLMFKKRGGNIHALGCYAPHSGLDLETVRQPFWEKLEHIIEKIPGPQPVYVTGDFNVRFQAHHPRDEGVTGPFVYGKGKAFIDHNAGSNRSLCLKTLQALHMCEVCSFKTPNMEQQITYKEKNPPPQDWMQFVVDPLPLLQFYNTLSTTTPTCDMLVASKVRSYLGLPDLLPPIASLPSANPTQFQKLDHTFTRKQWLPTIHSCRSFTNTGYPSDHYLLVTTLQVRLAARPRKPPGSLKLHIGNLDDAPKDAFNAALQDLLFPEQEPPAPATDHNARVKYFTDGSGSRGKCTKHTLAGWGWCHSKEGLWVEASGPVITDHNAPDYMGAEVGSNNTGELTAIAEALLHAKEHQYTPHIHTDSLWPINVLTGRWRPQRHKQLVGYIKSIISSFTYKVRFQWVKGHAGHEGNEKADTLAERGKNTRTRAGGRTLLPPARPQREAPDSLNPDHFVNAMHNAARKVFQAKARKARTPWITDATLQSLEEATAAKAQELPQAKHLRNKAKRQARKDRVDWVHRQLEADPEAMTKGVWNAIRNQKKGFRGVRRHLVVQGKPVPWTKTHEAMRDHLQNTQWAQRSLEDPTGPRPQIHPQHPEDHNFSIEELQTALRKLKTDKAPGPDGLQNEVILLLDEYGELQLLDIFNEAWNNGTIPDTWLQAKVVSIYKGKGDDADPSSYRPISLLNGFYKIYASLIQARLATYCEERIRRTQYGFRPRRGTQQPLFLLRRFMEWSRMTDHNSQLLFLDWKQAFDSVDHKRMMQALQRFGISTNAEAAISSLYSKPTFSVQGFDSTTAQGTVAAGIRQGCPLSPYLFIIVLSVILHDMDQTLRSQGTPFNTWSEGRPIYDVEYADDTLLLALTTTQMQQFLAALESGAAEYGMSLNSTKTELLVKDSETTSSLTFRDGTAVPTTTHIKYLGSMISWEQPFDIAFRHRAALAEEAYKKLRLVWNSRRSLKHKLYVFRTTFVPTLCYGLDALTLTDQHLHKIDAWYHKFLRRVLGIKVTYYSRISNWVVWNQANRPQLPSTTLQTLQIKALASIVCSSPEDPLHSIVFCHPLKDRIQAQGRRKGMQFPYWIEVTTHRHFPSIWVGDHTARRYAAKQIYGQNEQYVILRKTLKNLQDPAGQAPKRASYMRAWH